MIILDLPHPISTNALWTNARGKGRVRTKRYCEWMRAAGWMIRAAKPKQMRDNCALKLTVTEKYRGDLDNCFKAALDILQECGVVINDRQFKRLTVQFGPVDGMRVEIAPLDESARAAA